MNDLNVVEIDAINDPMLMDNLVRYSHGAFTLEDLTDLLAARNAVVVKINDRLITGLSFSEDVVSFFGFHGEMEAEDLNTLDEYSRQLALEAGVQKIQFLSPRAAWQKLLKPLKYKAIMFVYETEV